MGKPCCKLEIWGGIECTINRVNDHFFDQLQYSGHYQREEDIDAIAALNIKKIRYPILWEKHQPQKDVNIDWEWTRNQLSKLRERNIEVIAGLVHHGSGPAFTSLADSRFPYLLAEYAGQVARQFPWITYYTPVNEPLTTARFSGLYGLWYPHQRKASAFLPMLLHQLKGIVLSMQEIRKINPNAQLVQTEDLGKTYSTPKLNYQAGFENERRWLTYDILCGKLDKSHALWHYFLDNKITEADLRFFIENPCIPDVFGFNHYLTSERFLDERLALYPEHTYGGNGRHRYADIEAVRVELEEETGLEVLLKEAWNRYQRPLAVTEVHLHSHREEQLRWFTYVRDTSTKLLSEGIDIKAITSWALLGSYGWNRLLTQHGGDYEPGAFDLRSGSLRPTALANFIKNLEGMESSKHPVVLEKGWWQRNTRILYGPVVKEFRVSAGSHHPVLIIGKNGTLGKAFARICNERCIPFQLLSRQDCDISSIEQIEAAIREHKPWAIINAAGYVRVDEAEHDYDNCLRDNTTGAHNLAVVCNRLGIQLMSFSSDLVFDGVKNKPYIETDAVNPLNVYGQCKALSEGLIQKEAPFSLIIRTSAFFGRWDEYNFAHFVRKSLQQENSIKVAKDLYVSPTYVPDLANACLDILIDRETGIWHLANQGVVTWAELALRLAEEFDLNRSLIQAVSSSELNYTARRPRYSVLSSARGHLLPSLEHALERYIAEEKVEKRKVA